MKKTLAALAVLGAFAGTSMAADVTLYGIIDTGLVYGVKDSGVVTAEKTHSFSMENGVNSASRFGLKGEEDLGNGLKVGFVLENGFKSDTGALGDADRLFDREAIVYVNGAFGEVAFGRAGELASGNGRYAMFGGAVAPLSTGWGDYIPGSKWVINGNFGRVDNSVTYKTPKFAGINVLAQYSLDTNTFADNEPDSKDTVEHGTEGKNNVDREWAIGAMWAQGPANVSFVVTQIDKAKRTTVEPDDPVMVNLGGAYDFGVVKAFAAAQYFKDTSLKVGDINGNGFKKADGFGVNLGVSAPVAGGTVKANVGYMAAEQQVDSGKKPELDRITFAVGYEYPLSKRTFVYTAAGYYQDSYKNVAAEKDDDGKAYGATLGLVHKF